MKAWRFLLCTLALVAHVSRSDAQTETREQEAERRFNEARALVDAGRYPEACPLLARSLELDPAIGTEFNLADCLEHVGQRAAAWRHFRDVETTAHRVAKTEREKGAHDRAAALDEQLGQVTVQVPADLGQVTLALDGVALTRDQLETEGGMRVEPGTHTLHATASTREPWSEQFTLAAKQHLELHAFREQPATPQPRVVLPAPAPPPKRGVVQRRIAIGVGALGVAGLAVGGVAGIFAIRDHGDARDLCPEPKQCGSRDGVAEWNRATSAGNVATAGIVAGAVVLAAGVVLWLTAPRGSVRTQASTLVGGTF